MNDDLAAKLAALIQADLEHATFGTTASSQPQSSFKMEDLDRLMRLLEEKRPKPPFEQICVVRQEIQNPFIIQVNGKNTCFISRSMWSQIAAQMYYIAPSPENNFMGGGYGCPVIFEPDPEPIKEREK